ncbi:MAG: beta-ketoacyl-[acyl-carrier-protein] synthase II [Candidatus Marinimicrobia bacterium]|jgi:3-oxoacyl-[acyl-carrier-protein] synthase II|uniref:Ketosynthase family 3 (KS3) domain-containing protein n=1 Tax=marine metagenome TaxID=408172 RepID=A0A381U794_9ZZZZ|nr:beta-ketoacyl-[acyl-carrier-protein] synthase II [Candidatus Neomarinimicrobiota bacterium]MBH82015.1 beta-ketoacyl-[acyl-carrier-protein] synthase II [Candidatus Neomarinimicrobiota bacterium]|tara:strand:- start:2935 stop:4176 length:1242 start_codon:yes stop_codon:yes gene_type:complete
MTREKIVITGLGAVAPNGNSVDEFWTSLTAGISGIGPITCFDPSGHRVKIAGELSGFEPESVLDPKEIRKLDPFSVYALVATDEAVTMAGVNPEKLNLDRVGVTIGTGVGGIQTLEDQHSTIENRGARRVSPQFVPKMIANIAGGHLSIRWGFQGPNQTVTSACASATDAIGLAMRLIIAGDADMMITGGTEASITPLTIAGFANMRALSQSNDEPERASRPFDNDRDGFVLGEGAGMLVIETEGHAKNRGATILAELAGYGSTDDAFHITQPPAGGTGALKAMERAVQDAELGLNEIDYINAHGTSTPFNDKNESSAIAKLFKNHSSQLKVSSTKSMTGHLLGAAGGIEAVASVKTILEQTLPPTINYETPDPDCTLDYVPNTAQTHTVNAVLSNTFGFGGHNAVICIRKYC